MNKFIVYEGLDACGKTTLSSRYAQERNTTVHSAILKQAEQLRKIIDANQSKESALLFFMLNNFLKSDEVAKARESGDVILDRYLFSTLAYQTILLGEEKVKTMFDALDIANNIVLPDVIVFVKADAETINNRIKARGGEIQWYGDAITQNHCVGSAYKTIFNWFDIPIIEIDTSEKLGLTVEETYQKMKEKMDRVVYN
ncbi:dTMP kinase [Vibrio navarrensis]|uniref:dTMP kinase n=1 Tax=Vibrio navarrensis TaxID=29495 RepID=A0AAJ4ICU3_9VIBR|nr:dTMP kinase [Vibrio navarrensis]MBE3652490.1 thymidylate kinase [Vibrio navarrensis]MBE4591904.1 thymidylate kinase [Vibrio navarrensis]QPL54603.1 thymidylate kinase [Vibrio navarrensis]